MGALTKATRRARVRIVHRRSRRQPLLVIPSLGGDTGPDVVAPHHRNRVATHVSWGLGGFLLGMVVWQLLGIWTFMDTTMSELALYERNVVHPTSANVALRHNAMAEAAVVASPSVAVVAQPAFAPTITPVSPVANAQKVADARAPNCSELFVNPLTGETLSRPCDLRTGIGLGEPKPFQTAQRTDLVF